MSASTEIKQFNACQHESLSEGQGCMVTRCTCGHLHLRIGVLTLRLTPKQLADMASTLVRAAGRVECETEARPQYLC